MQSIKINPKKWGKWIHIENSSRNTGLPSLPFIILFLHADFNFKPVSQSGPKVFNYLIC